MSRFMGSDATFDGYNGHIRAVKTGHKVMSTCGKKWTGKEGQSETANLSPMRSSPMDTSDDGTPKTGTE